MGQEVDAATLGDEWAGYVFRITGGNDKQGFPMKQGVLTQGRVRLLLSKGHSCYRQRRTGERKRKSVRGCIVDGNLSVISVVIEKKGDNEIPGLTDSTIPRRLGPKRASKIRKLFNLEKDDNVRNYVIKRPLPVKEGKKPQFKAPKVRLLLQSFWGNFSSGRITFFYNLLLDTGTTLKECNGCNCTNRFWDFLCTNRYMGSMI